MSRLLDYNPLTGERVTFHYRHDTGEFGIAHHQDTTPIIERNKRAVIERNHAAQSKNDMIHYASIPNVVIVKWKNELGVDFFNRDHKKKWMALLNSPEYKYLKTTTYHHDR